MRPYEVATAAALIVVAAVAMYDSRAGMTIAPGATNIPSGFYPFWSAALVLLAAGTWLVRILRKELPAAGPYADPEAREGLRTVGKVALPMVVAAALIPWLGLYMVALLYLAFFAWFIGRYHWYWILPMAVITPLVLFVVFERFFRVPLPKSIFYSQGLLPF